MPRKRHDPVDAPIDGDYTYDIVHSKDPDKDYVWTSPEDMPRIKARGGVRTERGGAVTPAWDMGSDSDAGFSIGNLTLMEIPKERNERYHAQAQARNDQRNSAHKRAAKKSGGKYDRKEGTV